jgi:V/A-type H+-transporting ATPase subunit C
MVTLRGDPVYALTKAYALKSLLMPFSMLEELAYSRDLADFVERLRASPYGTFLAQLQKPYRASEVEKAFWRGLVSTHYSFVTTALRPGLLEALFMRYIYFNIKTVLKAKAIGKTVDEIMKTVDLYPETLLKVRDQTLRAAAAKDLSEALKELAKTPLAATASAAVSAWSATGDFSAVEAVIDKLYVDGLLKAYRKLPRSERKLHRQFVAIDVDSYALAAALRSRLWGLTSPQVSGFLPTETIDIPLEMLVSLATSDDWRKVFEEIPKTSFLEKIEVVEDPSKMAAEIEERASLQKIRYAARSFYKTPFRQVNIQAFLILKEAEVRNLSTIGKNIEEGVADIAFIRSLLIPY